MTERTIPPGLSCGSCHHLRRCTRHLNLPVEPDHRACHLKPADFIPKRFTVEAEALGCLCYSDGKCDHYPDACPIHGWSPDATEARVAECIRDKRAHHETTQRRIVR